MEIVLKNGRLQKKNRYKKFVVSLTIVNYKPSLTIINEERMREETDLKGIGTYHREVLKKISRSFSSPHNFVLQVRQRQPFVNDR